MSRILFITEFAGFSGGIERYAFDLARLLRGAGHRVELLAETSAFAAGEFAGGFDGVRFTLPGGDERFDFAVIHKCRSAELWQRLAERFGPRLIAVAHDHDLYCPRKYLYTPCGRVNCGRAYAFGRCSLCGLARRHPEGMFAALRETLLDFPRRLSRLRSCGRVVALSRFMCGNLIRNGVAPGHLRLIHPAVAPAERGTGSGDPATPRIGFSGQLIRGKGADTLLRILARLPGPYTAVLAGDGNERGTLRALASELGVRAEFTGFLTDLDAFYRSCDLMVLPFRWQEPFGLVGIEAAARGVPSAAFAVGGVTEWLTDGVTGAAVPPGDTAALASAVRDLLADPERRRALGDAARARVRSEFTTEKLLENWNCLLMEES